MYVAHELLLYLYIYLFIIYSYILSNIVLLYIIFLSAKNKIFLMKVALY